MQRISLRPVLLFTISLSLLYLVFSAAVSLRSLSQTGETAKLKTFDLIVGILLLAAAIVELLGLSAAWTSRLSWTTLYARASTGALALVVGAEVVGIIEHYAAKTDLIDGCTTRNTGTGTDDSSSWWLWGSNSAGASANLTAAEAREYCEARWSRSTAWVIIWYVLNKDITDDPTCIPSHLTHLILSSPSSPDRLIIVVFIGTLFVLLAFAFLRQLRDPTLTRASRRGVAGAGAYSSAFNDDDETSPFESSRPDGGPYSYPPPPSSPPPRRGAGAGAGAAPSLRSEGGFSASSSDAPEYSPHPEGALPRKSMQSIDLDRKDSRGPGGDGDYEYEDGYVLNYGGGGARGRPESSRSVRHVGEEGRRSDETLRGDGEEGEGGRAGGVKI